MEKQYKAVFFDLGGTLRIAFLEEAYMRHARRKMAEIEGTDMPYEEFYQMIDVYKRQVYGSIGDACCFGDIL